MALQKTVFQRCLAVQRSRYFTHRTITTSFCLDAKVSDKTQHLKRTLRALSIGYVSSRCPFHTTIHRLGKTVQFALADIGEGIKEVTVKGWYVSVGDRVNQFDNICEVESDKAVVTITSRYDGVITKCYYSQDDTAYVGMPLVDIELSEGAHETVADDLVDDIQGSSLTATSDLQATVGSISLTSSGSRVLATPAVRRLAAENKISLSDVSGTGKAGRVLKEDILNFLKAPAPKLSTPTSTPTPAAPTPAAPSSPARTSPVITKPLEDQIIPLKGIRLAMSRAMAESLKIPHFGYSDEIDMTQLVTLRTQLKGSQLLKDVAFSYMPVIIKATSMALKEFPILNSSLHESGKDLILKASHNIGFAMDTEYGLIVPNVRSVESLSVLEIAAEMRRLITDGEAGRLKPDDMSGGTFSLSNIGSIGGTYASPVILTPEVAIGALGKIQKLPRFDEQDNVIKAQIMNVSWSADHRVIEGAQMCRFSNLWKSYLENPAWMILNLR